MRVLTNCLEWLQSKQFIFIGLLLVTILIRGCNFNYTYIVTSDKTNCNINDLELKNTPEPPIDGIVNAKGDYKTKTLIMTSYIEQLHKYIADQKEDIDAYQKEVREKCQK